VAVRFAARRWLTLDEPGRQVFLQISRKAEFRAHALPLFVSGFAAAIRDVADGHARAKVVITVP